MKNHGTSPGGQAALEKGANHASCHWISRGPYVAIESGARSVAAMTARNSKRTMDEAALFVLSASSLNSFNNNSMKPNELIASMLAMSAGVFLPKIRDDSPYLAEKYRTKDDPEHGQKERDRQRLRRIKRRQNALKSIAHQYHGHASYQRGLPQ